MKKVLSFAMVMVIVLTTNVSFAASNTSNPKGLILESKASLHQQNKLITYETNDLVELPFNYSTDIHIQKSEGQIVIKNNNDDEEKVAFGY